jgi:sigma-E factor negative regulatory protein RseA
MVLGITFYNETPTEIAHESSSVANDVDDYLLAHQEFSPSTMMQGMAPYVRTVSVTREAK